jgi:uncharacterized protein YxjI
MKLLFKQRMFSWFDSYDIYYEDGSTAYTVKGQLSLGHCLKIRDAAGHELGMVKERVIALLPRFDLYLGEEKIGEVKKELTLLHPKYDIDCRGWHVEGSVLEWDYRILNQDGSVAAVISKELFHLTDTYVIDVKDPQDAIYALMLVLAIDAEKCSRSS